MKWYEKYPSWENMTQDQKSEFIKQSVEESHKQQYYSALEWAGVDGPKWEDLTEEQRINIREENRSYQQEMHEFGKSLGNYS
jgi:hypothetical protein